MPNRLAHETSPYLLQHKDNPVDWYPWGPEAIERAVREQKPIFLSIGYSACHWCHVMEHESFENKAIAKILNEHFISIKVDREERPDLDQIYMNAVQMLTGRGGWPMSLFLTPELKPFFGGTYWPPHASRGMPGFDQVLVFIRDTWKNRREQALKGAEQLTAELQRVSKAGAQKTNAGDVPLSVDLLDGASRQMERAFDSTYGGFGEAPKFPHAMALQLLLRVWHRQQQPGPLAMVRKTLDRMAGGGIYDHLGGGFSRYSVDDRWLVPHFEKMLYDNGLLTSAYIEGFLATRDENYARVVRETLDYVLRDMTDPAGGFYSSEDADSEGEEGKFYTWSPVEIEAVLGSKKSTTFCTVYDVTKVGNFEGKNILNLPKTIAQHAAMLDRDEKELAVELATSRAQLLAEREKRVRPGRDDKVLVAWNGFMIDAMARAGAALDEPRYLEAAQRAALFLLDNLQIETSKRGAKKGNRLLHVWRQGKAKLDAYLDDYTSLAGGLVSLYEATAGQEGSERFIDEAVRLIDVVLDKFSDPNGAGFFYTASDHEELIARNKEWTDGSTPSGNAMAATVLVRLGAMLGRNDYLDAAEGVLQAVTGLLERAPLATSQFLLALDDHLGPMYELVLVGDFSQQEARQALAALGHRYLPRCVVTARNSSSSGKAMRSKHLDPMFAGKTSSTGAPMLFVCQNFTCQKPLVGLEAIEKKLAQLAREAPSVR